MGNINAGFPANHVWLLRVCSIVKLQKIARFSSNRGRNPMISSGKHLAMETPPMASLETGMHQPMIKARWVCPKAQDQSDSYQASRNKCPVGTLSWCKLPLFNRYRAYQGIMRPGQALLERSPTLVCESQSSGLLKGFISFRVLMNQFSTVPLPSRGPPQVPLRSPGVWLWPHSKWHTGSPQTVSQLGGGPRCGRATPQHSRWRRPF